MKYFFLVFLAVSIFGCGVETPQFGGDSLFIVNSIRRYDDSLSSYTQRGWNNNDLLCFSPPTIIARTGLFQIGDTIFIKK